jgi:hypothetical protein
VRHDLECGEHRRFGFFSSPQVTSHAALPASGTINRAARLSARGASAKRKQDPKLKNLPFIARAPNP